MACSYIVIPSVQAKNLAEETLVHIEKEREKGYQEKAEKILTRFNGIRKFFRLPLFVPSDKDIKEVIQSIKADHYDYTYLWYFEQERVAKRVLHATKYADEINLSIEDLNLLT